MPRVKKSSASKKHKKLIRKTKGFIGRRKNVYRIAKQAYIKSLIYARRDRKRNQARYRRENIVKISSFIKEKGINTSYSRLINSLLKRNIIIDRKILGILTNKNYSSILEDIIRTEKLGR
ncbi:50S ribosomal protein L20 [Candidatus Vidania fulgoroideae]|uniref:50S ribosomal protein L20 n=1 Tax=Candidatus Vidania fulgoroideorum TaxID=881286 RepID=A0A974X7C4_9PROT|nr:50S ribosomal protein L20 [Candidatus Vidania fulgoroideae]